MENIRDGLEDSAAYSLLRSLLAAANSSGLSCSDEAAALSVPDTVVGQIRQPPMWQGEDVQLQRAYTEDPWVARQQWRAVADAIESVQNKLATLKSDDATVRSSDGAEFSALTLVGERWDNGGWGVLDKTGKQVGDCKRGDPNCSLMWSPSQPPGLMRLSANTSVCAANDSVYFTQTGGRSWTRDNKPGHASRIWSSVPAPSWLTGFVSMDISPIE